VNGPDAGAAGPRARTASLTVAGPAGAIEAIVDDPGSASPPAFGILCHPHPLYGGSMTNKVVHTLARALNDVGLPAVRFNFRGVGASAGTYDEGRGETLDLLAVLRDARARWPAAAFWLGGFSFGAYVALRAQALEESAPARLLVVAPPVGRWDFSPIASPRRPWLVVQGGADDVVDAGAVAAWVAGQPRAPRYLALPEAGHFFHGRLAELREAVRAFAADGLAAG
jgi:hypothetical protein